MNNFIPQASTSSPTTTTSGRSPGSAFSFLSKGWREVRDSADADLQLMRDRAKSFKNLASSFDREIENFINSASSPFITSGTTSRNKSAASSYAFGTMEIDFVKKLQPKLSEFRRVYSSPEFSRKVLEKWPRGGKPRLGIDLSAIRNAIVEEVELEKTGTGTGRGRGRGNWEWKEERERSSEKGEDWEPIRVLKKRWRELEGKKAPEEIFGAWKNSELVEKFKSSLVE